MGAVLRNNGFTLSLLDCLDRNDPVLISSKKYSTLDDLPFSVFDQNQNVYRMPLLTSRSCPPRCSIFASCKVSGKFKKCSVDPVVDEIAYSNKKYHIRDFVFYDDALLSDKENHIIPILEHSNKSDPSLRFHTPNGLQAGAFDKNIALEKIFKLYSYSHEDAA